ncbi:MAG: hypothetical protein QXJ28_01145 [Candidatus Pacearchaeota archaeon]
MLINRKQFIKSIIAGSLYIIQNNSYSQNPVAYPHLREWNKDEFEKYSKWVENIYTTKSEGDWKQKSAKIDRIFVDDEMNLLNNKDFIEEGNPQLPKETLSLMNSLNHCGSFPKLVFLYYSYRRGLPSIITKINSNSGGDIRYSSGNHPIELIRSRPFHGNFADFLIKGMSGKYGGYNFVSGNYRTSPFLEETDSVPIEINREFLKPGSMAYNCDGHCLLVGKIDDSGEIHFLDSHPDRSITFNQTMSALYCVNSAFTTNKDRWYDGFRNMRLSKTISGSTVYFSNLEMREFGFSLDQYEKMIEIIEKRKDGGLEVKGRKVMDFREFVKARLQRKKELPLEILKKSASELASMFRERELFVQEAWKDVIINGPITFPNDLPNENIYQSSGRWEMWSSPSSDVDRKNKYDYLASRLEKIVQEFPNSVEVDYSEFNSQIELAKEIIEKKNLYFSEEIVIYKKSNGEEVILTLNDIEKRLFDLSFNPNHPPELRWGAPEGSKEREGMKLIKVPLSDGRIIDALESYELEKGLRYYQYRQNSSSSLNPDNNPKEPPFQLIEERIKKYIQE